jgi:hypothetical protein
MAAGSRAAAGTASQPPAEPHGGRLDYRARPRPSAQPHRGPPGPRLTPTPGCAMLPNTTERTVSGKAEPCIISLQALRRTNRAGTSCVLSPHPRARDLPTCGLLPPSSSSCVLAFLRTMRAFSRSSQPPPAAPGRGRSRSPIPDPRSPNAWGFLQELFSRARMGFPPAVAVAETRLVRLRRRPDTQDPNAWGFLRPLTLSSSLPPRPPPAVALHSSRSHAPRPKGVWPFFLGQTRPAFPSCSPDLTPFPLPTLGEGALSTRQTRLHHLGVRSPRHDDRRSGTSTAERRLLTPRPTLTTMSACKHVFPIGGSHAGHEARGDVDA